MFSFNKESLKKILQYALFAIATYALAHISNITVSLEQYLPKDIVEMIIAIIAYILKNFVLSSPVEDSTSNK